MTRAAAYVACLAASIIMLSPMAHGEPPPPIPSETTPALRDLLLAADGDGKPLVSQDDLIYFASLPEHARALLASAVTDEWITSATHLHEILALRLSVGSFEVAMADTCLLCHTDAESQSEDTLFVRDPAANGSNAHLNLEHFVSDVHFQSGLSCAGCHGGDPTKGMDHDFPKTWPENATKRHEDRKWVPEFCASCHSNAAFMRQYDADLPTDQLDKYKTSRHGTALLGGENPRAAECTSCHGVHGIQGAGSPNSSVHPTRVPDTCGACHARPQVMAGAKLRDGSPIPTDQFEEYRDSVHGRALLEKGNVGAPACNDCHGNHAAMPPEISSVSQVCRTCHVNNAALLEGSLHKKAFNKHGWPECGACHGDHGVKKPSDDALAREPGALCAGCHDEYARDNPECAKTTEYFHSELASFVQEYEEFAHQAERLARRGIDVEEMESSLVSLADSLKQSRSSIHAFDRGQFDAAATPARESIDQMGNIVVQARAELRSRVVGMLIAAGFILATILMLWLKLRRLERR